jgi:hypothetical protein
MSKQQVRTRLVQRGPDAFLLRHPHFVDGMHAGADVYRARYGGPQFIKDTDILQFLREADSLASLYFPAYAGLVFGWMQAHCAEEGRRIRFCNADFLASFLYAGQDHNQGLFCDLDSDVALMYFLRAFLQGENQRTLEIDTFEAKAGYACRVIVGLLNSRQVVERTEPPEPFGQDQIKRFQAKVRQLFALEYVEVVQ